MAFVPDWLRGKAQVNQETIQRVSAGADRGGGGVPSRGPEEGLGCGECPGAAASPLTPGAGVLTLGLGLRWKQSPHRRRGQDSLALGGETLGRSLSARMSCGPDPVSDPAAPGGE